MIKLKNTLLTLVFLASAFSFCHAQITLPFTETFNSTYSSNFYRSAGTSNSGNTYTCTTANGIGQITSSDYMTTKTVYVGQGKGVSISFKLKSGGTFTAPDVYVRMNNAYSFSTLSPTDNGWVKIGSASTSACGNNTFTVPSEVAGGQRMAVTIHFKNASSTNWIAIEDLSISETTGNSVSTSYTENFTVNNWWNSGSYPKVSYHSTSSTGNCYVYLFSGGVGGSFDYYAALTTGFDPNTTNFITHEINTGGYSKGELRYSFKSQYPCGGPNSYTFDETYNLYAPKAYIMVGADNGSNTWQQLPMNSYFPDATWRYAAVDISAYKNSNIKIKFERGGFCSNPLEGVDNIKVLDRDCSISSLTCGPITGTTSPSPNTNYNYSVGSVAGATYYKWFVRNGGTLYESSPYIVSGQGTQNATINFGNLVAPLRVICVPFDANPSLNTDACYAKLAYTSMTTCTIPVIGSTTSTNPSTCGGTDGHIKLNGLTANTTYSVTYSKDGSPVGAVDYNTDANGVLTINNLSKGSYTNIIAAISSCASVPVAGPIVLSDPAGSAVGTPVFNLGSTSSRCTGAGSVTYTATATNNTGITYTLDATSLGAGNTINASTGQVTYTGVYVGTAVITATATGCNGPTTATHTVTISATPGVPVFNLGTTSTRCEGAGNVTYTATSANSTSISYSLDITSLGAGNTIDVNTGQVSWIAGYSGTGVITATAAGCGGPSVSSHTVTITPTVSAPIFSSGASSVRCVGSGTVTYSATASNNTGITYSLDGTSLGAGNTINSSTGAVTFTGSYTGIAVITASAAGCNGPATSAHTVTISAPTGTPVFASGNTSNRCQGAGSFTYSATAANSNGITYSLDNTSLSSGNLINPSTGEVTYTANYTGTSVITALATGCANPATATHIVTIIPPVTTPVFSSGSISTRCTGAGSVTYTATASNSTSITYTIDGTSSGAGNSINSSTGAVTYTGSYSGTTIITASAAGCGGPKTTTHTVTISPPPGVPVFTSGSSSSRCQGAGTVTYGANASNTSGIIYSLDFPSLGAGNTINASTGQVSWIAGYSGTGVITASASGCGSPTTATHTVTITATVGTPEFPNGSISSTRCSGETTSNYGATATNSTGITYSLDANSLSAGNTINASNGIVTWNPSYTGSATITATATGCNGPTSNTLTVFFNPPAGTPVFALGTSSSRCQGIGAVTYSATSTNSPTVKYHLDATALAGGNTIDSLTGTVTWAAGYSGSATITAIATGCGNPTANHTVTINASAAAPVFALGSSSGRCGGLGTVTYSATSSGSSSISYSLDAAALNAGNTINPNTGEVTWAANYLGTAIITASAAGCGVSVTATHTVTIATPVTPTISITATPGNIICAGTTVTFNASTSNEGNSPVYTWKKNNNTVGNNGNSYADNALSNGDIITCVLTSDAACASQTNVTANPITMNIKPIPAVPVSGSNSPICEGDDLQLNCSPISNASYSWTGPQGFVSSQQNPLISQVDLSKDGSYYVAVTVDGCTGNPAEVIVVVNSKPTVPVISASGSSLTSSVAGASYQWYLDGAPINGATSQSFNAIEGRTYTVQVTDDNGCQSTSPNFNFIKTGLTDLNLSFHFNLYPNPISYGNVQISIDRHLIGGEWKLFDVAGKEIARGMMRNEKEEWDISSLSSGIYCVKIAGAVRKLVKE